MKQTCTSPLLIAVAIMSMSIVPPQPVFAADPQAAMEAAQAACTNFLAQIQDIQLEQTMTMTAGGDSSVMTQRIFRKGARVRTEIRAVYPPSPFGSTPTVVIGDGTKSWVISVMERRELEPEEASEFESEKLCWDFQGHAAQPVGTHMVNGRECIEIMMNEGDNSYSIDLDPLEHLIRGGRAYGAEGDSVGWEYSDFRDVGTGYKLPFQTTMYSGLLPMSTLRVGSIAVNKGLADELFDPAKVEMPSAEDVIKTLEAEQDK
jgi:outer membrane lipoprotein-sorting protein